MTGPKQSRDAAPMPVEGAPFGGGLSTPSISVQSPSSSLRAANTPAKSKKKKKEKGK